MVVHYVPAGWEDAEDRFLGPVKLLERAKALLPELTALPAMPWEWKPWVDALEASGRLIPVLRWRVPEAALLWLWARHDGRAEDMQASEADAAPGVNALAAWDQARHAWTRDPEWARSAHPLDEPADDWAMVVENPANVPWTPQTYSPLWVKTLWTGHDHLDENRCVPLFRGWQALLLVEHVLAEPRCFPPLVANGGQGTPSGLMRWSVATRVEGFVRHRAALEALSWFVSYRQHALQHAKGEKPDPGMFAPPGTVVSNGRSVIRGAAWQALLAEEERVAREALERHGLDEERLLAAATWLGRTAQDRRRTGHAAASAAYADVMRDAIELLVSLGHTRDDVTAKMEKGNELRREFFPDFEEHARERLRHQLRLLAAEFRSRPDVRFDEFDDARVEEFVGWLEARGLLAAHMAVPAIMAYGYRPDRSAEVGVALHVSAVAAWVEHVAGELTSAATPPPSLLHGKLKGCWDRHPAEAEFRQAWKARQVDDAVPFPDAVKKLLATPANDSVGWMARDALVARKIRNQSLHQGLRTCTRMEMQDATCILLRTAMGAWLVAR